MRDGLEGVLRMPTPCSSVEAAWHALHGALMVEDSGVWCFLLIATDKMCVCVCVCVCVCCRLVWGVSTTRKGELSQHIVPFRFKFSLLDAGV